MTELRVAVNSSLHFGVSQEQLNLKFSNPTQDNQLRRYLVDLMTVQVIIDNRPQCVG
jgi:hypothetical protein